MLNHYKCLGTTTRKPLTNEFVPQVLSLDVVLEAASHDVDAVVVAWPQPRETLAGRTRVHLLDGLQTLFARFDILHLLRNLETRLQGLQQQKQPGK